MTTFSALLLAGGKSSRMGQDKALLPVPAGGWLWQRQLHVLRELRPEEIFWSGPPRDGVPADVRIVADAVKDAGPLAGLSACLDLLRSDLLVVLAIDLPAMHTEFLRSLLSRCSDTRGIVARHGDYFEPLAAIYPKALAPLTAKHLADGQFALQALVRVAAEQNLVEIFSLSEDDAPLFRNVNSPGDL
jgi:molybdopterin-guanine dinucleotide biosynthesis protein A